MHSEATRELFRLVARMTKFCRRQQDDSPIPGDMAVFGLLFHQRELTGEARVRMTELSRCLMISKPAATQAVNRLVAQGLVERVNDPTDRRVVSVQPTPAGVTLFSRELEKRLAATDRAVARIGEARAAQLAELLNAFLDAMISDAEEN